MKTLKYLLGVLVCYLFFIFLGTTNAGCVKQNTVHDTTTVTIRDTVNIKDTITIIDTLNNLNSGLVAYYNFNGGNLYDSSGNNNNIVFSNATKTTDRLGNPNNAFLFSGDSCYMEVKNSTSINPQNITLFAIVNVNKFYNGECHYSQIFGKGNSDAETGIYGLRFVPFFNGAAGVCASTVDTTTEIFGGGYGDPGANAVSWQGTLNSYAYIHEGDWYTVAYTFDGNNSRLYVNGALISSVPKSGAVTFTANTDDLYIGKSNNSVFPYNFNGVIDEIRIYNKAISSSQVGYLNLMKDKYMRINNKLVY